MLAFAFNWTFLPLSVETVNQQVLASDMYQLEPASSGTLPSTYFSFSTGPCAKICRLAGIEVTLLRNGSEHLGCSNSVHISIDCVLRYFQFQNKSTEVCWQKSEFILQTLTI